MQCRSKESYSSKVPLIHLTSPKDYLNSLGRIDPGKFTLDNLPNRIPHETGEHKHEHKTVIFETE